MTAPKSLSMDEVGALVEAELARLAKEGKALREAWKLLQRAVKRPDPPGGPFLQILIRQPKGRKGARR